MSDSNLDHLKILPEDEAPISGEQFGKARLTGSVTIQQLDIFNEAVHLQKVGDLRRSIDAFQKLLPSVKEPFEVWFNVGLCHSRLSEHAAARHAMRESIEACPLFRPAYGHLARIAEQLGEYDLAREAWRRYRSL